MDRLKEIRRPIEAELGVYREIFDEALTNPDAYLGLALKHIGARQGKMMRPILVLLVAKELGAVNEAALKSAVTLELLHTASLVHDDIVDESNERRGQASTNQVYGNKAAVLLGDYLLSEALHYAGATRNIGIVSRVAHLGRTLSEGEIAQLWNIRNDVISEEVYFRIITDKTASLFATCAELGALSMGASPEFTETARRLGEIIGICFQIRDDIFDYYEDSAVGKPTGNDMAEGKLTLPVIHALKATQDARMEAIARAVKTGEAGKDDIAVLVQFTKDNGGIAYAERVMDNLKAQAQNLLKAFGNAEVRASLEAYLDFIIERKN